MLYRIRYREAQASCESEVVLEANSPTEALVKFRHTGAAVGHAAQLVTSVSADDHDNHVPA